MNINIRAVFLCKKEHAGVRDKDRVGLQLFQFPEISGCAFQIAVVRKDIRRDMYAGSLFVRVADALRHVFR